jgi:arginine utilization protein RocB
MAGPIDARALTGRLVRVASISPDVAGENACARVLLEALPDGIERGTWPSPDGRDVAWARVRGRRPDAAALLLLGHHDTVGAREFESLGDGRLAFDPEALRERFVHGAFEIGDDAGGEASGDDLAEERTHPGTWTFGRGALDMKSGLAAGAAALAALQARPADGDVWLVSCPDEESASAGMLAAVEKLAALAREGTRFAGALNLDYAHEPAAFAGVMGKALAAVYVVGRPAHAGRPFDGVDATQLAALIAARATTSDRLVDRSAEACGPPAVALRLRDLKERYDLQTAVEAELELNLLTCGRTLAATFDVLRDLAHESLVELESGMASLRTSLSGHAKPAAFAGGEVLTWRELEQRAGSADLFAEDGEPRAATLARLRRKVREARLRGPAVILHLMPPYYPASAPGRGPLVRAARRVLEAEGVPVRAWYPYVSDASYLAWRSEPADALATWMPSWGRSYALPVEAMQALDLDVVNLGPWGRDAHGLLERVHAPWAFERLPALIERVAREALAVAP